MNLATSHHWLKVVSAHVVHPVLLSWWRLIYDLNRSMHKSNSSSRDALIRYDISIDQHLSWLTASLGKRQRWVPSYIQSTSQAQKTCFNVQIICCQNRLMTSTHTNKQTRLVYHFISQCVQPCTFLLVLLVTIIRLAHVHSWLKFNRSRITSLDRKKVNTLERQIPSHVPGRDFRNTRWML